MPARAPAVHNMRVELFDFAFEFVFGEQRMLFFAAFLFGGGFEFFEFFAVLFGLGLEGEILLGWAACVNGGGLMCFKQRFFGVIALFV